MEHASTDPITSEKLRELVAFRELGIPNEDLDEWVNNSTEAMSAAADEIERLNTELTLIWDDQRYDRSTE